MSKYEFRGEDISALIKYRDVEIQKCISCNSEEFEKFLSLSVSISILKSDKE